MENKYFINLLDSAPNLLAGKDDTTINSEGEWKWTEPNAAGTKYFKPSQFLLSPCEHEISSSLACVMSKPKDMCRQEIVAYITCREHQAKEAVNSTTAARSAQKVFPAPVKPRYLGTLDRKLPKLPPTKHHNLLQSNHREMFRYKFTQRRPLAVKIHYYYKTLPYSEAEYIFDVYNNDFGFKGVYGSEQYKMQQATRENERQRQQAEYEY